MAHRHSPRKNPGTKDRRANPPQKNSPAANNQQPHSAKRGQIPPPTAQTPEAGMTQTQKKKRPKKQSHGPRQKHSVSRRK